MPPKKPAMMKDDTKFGKEKGKKNPDAKMEKKEAKMMSKGKKC